MKNLSAKKDDLKDLEVNMRGMIFALKFFAQTGDEAYKKIADGFEQTILSIQSRLKNYE